MPIEGWMGNKMWVHTNGILLSHKKEGSPAICNNMGEHWRHHMKWNKPYIHCYSWCLSVETSLKGIAHLFAPVHRRHIILLNTHDRMNEFDFTKIPRTRSLLDAPCLLKIPVLINRQFFLIKCPQQGFQIYYTPSHPVPFSHHHHPSVSQSVLSSEAPTREESLHVTTQVMSLNTQLLPGVSQITLLWLRPHFFLLNIWNIFRTTWNHFLNPMFSHRSLILLHVTSLRTCFTRNQF